MFSFYMPTTVSSYLEFKKEHRGEKIVNLRKMKDTIAVSAKENKMKKAES